MGKISLAIVGSRGFTDYHEMKTIVDHVFQNDFSSIEKIVSGGAVGADSLARTLASELKVPLQEFLPDWKTFGRKAGPLRNADIIKAADVVIAFWDGTSSGTKSSIALAIKNGKRVFVYNVETKKLLTPLGNGH
jgi:predicted Rossmann fold nucleotide-binding protein DprA/Smf involved in DNA uptake